MLELMQIDQERELEFWCWSCFQMLLQEKADALREEAEEMTTAPEELNTMDKESNT